MICPECTAEMIKGARFCHACGWDTRLPGARERGASPRKRYQRWIMGTILGISLAAVLYFLMIPRSDAQAALLTGQPAPDFVLENLEGQEVRLSDQRGEVVVLNFWATWCPPCRAEMPDLEEFYQRHAGRGLVVLGINLQESTVAVRAFQEQFQLSFPLLLDRDGKVTDRYKIIPLPTTYFIDRHGVVQGKWEGQLTPQVLEGQVLPLLDS